MKTFFFAPLLVSLVIHLGGCIFDEGDHQTGGRRTGGGETADSGQPQDAGVTVNIVINLGDAAK